MLRRIKEWICSDRPITICATIKAWIRQGFQIWPRCDVTRRKLRCNMHRTRLLGYSPQPACSGWPAGFVSTCFIHLRYLFTAPGCRNILVTMDWSNRKMSELYLVISIWRTVVWERICPTKDAKLIFFACHACSFVVSSSTKYVNPSYIFRNVYFRLQVIVHKY